MASTVTIRFTRTDNKPWGFRLMGGKDFSSPLAVQKVTGASIAEELGLHAGDVISKINGMDTSNMRHKEAQEAIVRAGNNFELQIRRGGQPAPATIWKPQVSLLKDAKPGEGGEIKPMTKTSLAANPQRVLHAGSGHNVKVKPFGAPKAEAPAVNGTIPSIVNKQFNSPVGLYSEENIAAALSSQAEVLASGILGVNFKKNEKKYEVTESEVFKMVQDMDRSPRQAEAGMDIDHIDGSPHYKRLVNSNIQSYSFKRLQEALESGAEDFRPDPSVVSQSRPAVAPESPAASLCRPAGVRSVLAPVTKPKPDVPSVTPSQNTCAECERIIVGVFVRIKDKNLHVECFKCATCGTSLKNVGYYVISNKLYCDLHAKQAARHAPPAASLSPGTATTTCASSLTLSSEDGS